MKQEIIEALRDGRTLFIDEFDSGIHPLISKLIVELFYRCHSCAQLIINTHNASLLKYSTDDGKPLYNKNQVYLVNKNRYGESSLSALSDFSGLRSNLETLYLDGAVDGVPYISNDYLASLIDFLSSDGSQA